MKKTIFKILVLTLAVVMLVCSLAACGNKISGSYGADIEVVGQKWDVTYTFNGKNVEAVSTLTLFGIETKETATGTYEIIEYDDGALEIKFDFEKETTLFKDGTRKFEQGDDYIKLDGIQYNKK